MPGVLQNQHGDQLLHVLKTTPGWTRLILVAVATSM